MMGRYISAGYEAGRKGEAYNPSNWSRAHKEEYRVGFEQARKEKEA